MGWKTSSVMDEKLRFVFEFERDEESMKALCARLESAARPAMCGCGVTGNMGWRDWWK
jgi:hypothetical protein